MEDHDVKASLDAVSATRENLAQRLRWPFWRHAASGILLAWILFSMQLPSTIGIVMIAVTLLLVVAIIEYDKRSSGMYVSGFQQGRAGWVMIALIAIYLAGFFFIELAIDDPLADPRFWAIFVGIVPIATALSYLWARLYREDTLSGRI